MTTQLETRATTAVGEGRPPARDWLVVAAAMFVIGYGGNQFTPLLVVYRRLAGYSDLSVDIFLGAYVLGLIPGLLVASAASDRYGRRPLMLTGLASGIVGGGFLALGGPWGSPAIIGGRLFSGLAVGVAMSVGSAWINELTTRDATARPGSGARRASISLTAGLGVGPGVAGVLAQWGPLPLALPFLVQIALTAGVLAALRSCAVETRFDTGGRPLRDRLRVPAQAHRRFRRVVTPMAPWIFGSAAVAYVIVPSQVDSHVGRWALIFTAAITVGTLTAGLLIQPVARRLDDVGTARAVFVSMILMTLGLVGAACVAITHSPWLAFPVALLLGCAYGIAVVSGLLEVQRIAAPDELAGLTGVYYALAYIGFLLPATLAELARWVSYSVMLGVLAVIALGCTASIGNAWSSHLPVRAARRP